MKYKNRQYLKAGAIIFFCVITVIFYPDSCFSEETYRFKRMWPTLQQPWYFDNPRGIAIDGTGNVYVADWASDRIQKFNNRGQFITGWGSNGFGDGEFLVPEGVAIDGNENVYVVDSYNHRIQKFTADGDFVAKWGRNGTGIGEFNYPIGIAIDGSGYVYVTDRDNHRIQKFTTDGEFIRMWGIEGFNAGGIQSPHGIVIDSNGHVYVVDTDSHRVQKFTSEGDFISKWGSRGSGDGQFESPEGIAIDNIGNVFVADTGNDRIQKFDRDGQFIETWGNFGFGDGGLFWPADLTIDPKGSIWVADSSNDRIQLFTVDGDFITKWGSIGSEIGEFDDPKGIAIDANRNIYLADSENYRIQKFTADGQFIAQWGSLGSGDGEFINPRGVAIDENGYVYVADWWNHRIQKFTSDGEFMKKWGSEGSGDGEFKLPEGITIDKSGNVYVADTDNNRIQKFTSDGQFITKWGSLGTGDGEFNMPKGIAIDSSGNVYVADTYNHRIQKFTSEGDFMTKWGGWGGGNGQFSFPSGASIDHSGNLYVADSLNDRIQEFTSEGEYVTEWGTTGNHPGQINNPYALAVSSEDDIFLSDSSNHRIQVFKKAVVASNSKAIIIAGGGPFGGNNLWDATQMCANFTYRSLIYQGFTKESIYYLSSDTDLDLDNNGELDDVDADATNSNLQHAITSWASDADSLVLYLVDHGGDGTFRMSGTETLSASDLDSWLDQLQIILFGQVIVIYDACESGSFLAALTPAAGKPRVVMTSTSLGESAYFVTQGSVSFSNFFWTHVFNGINIKDAFELAGEAIEHVTDYQNPLLDANGNGVGNEAADFALVQDTYIGNGTIIYGSTPEIGAVSPAQTISGTNLALLFAEDVTDADDIARVWAVIRPPDYRYRSSNNPVQELPAIDLMPVGNDRYEATYAGFNIEGIYQIAIYAMDRIGNTSIPQLTTVSVDNPLRRKAIIVAGGSPAAALWPAVETNAGLAYETLNFQGYSDDDIYFLSPVTFSAGVDGLATLSNLSYAIGIWAVQDSQDVVLYLVGPGDVEAFQINSTETLWAAVLDAWLDSLQDSLPGEVAVVYDASHSGSFINLLTAPTDKKRIVISSTTNNQQANFVSSGDISFSAFFWRQVFNGASVRDAFVHAINAIGFAAEGQTPMLDDNGNGIANELGLDGRLAGDYTIGVGIMLAGNEPVIGSVSPAQILRGESSALIWAEDVTTTGTIDRVWSVVTPPGFDHALFDGPSDLPTFVLSQVDGGRYEGLHTDFTIFGTYQVAVYAKDTNGSISLPKITTVEQTIGSDIYEDDHTFAQANVIALNHALPQHHNFYEDRDKDWVKFYALAGEVYEIKISNVGSGADPVIALYDVDGTTLLKGPWSFGFEGEDELMNWVCPQDGDGVYYVIVYQSEAAVFDEDTRYDLEVYRPVARIAGFILGSINNSVTGGSISGAIIKTDANQTAISLPNGSYIMGHLPGSFYLTAEAPQYIPTSFSGIVVDEGGSTTRNFTLIPLDADGDGIPNDVDSDDDNDGMPDEWEEKYNLNPFIDDAGDDPDGDGVSNYEEYLADRDPTVNDSAHAKVKAFVTRFYQLCLSRNPDPVGLNTWVAGLLNGSLTGSDVAYGFVFSKEFTEKNNTHEEFLMVLYEAFFNRQPDPGGWQGWLDALNSRADRKHVLDGFIFATEFAELCDEYGIKAFEGHITKKQREAVEAFVTRFYQLCLGRNPDQPGLEGWSNNLLNQVQTGADVANGFIFSPEFIEKNTINSDFLMILYKAFFDRDPDPTGWDGWLSALNAGRDRGEILDGFIYSTEFSSLCGEYGIKAF